MKIFRRFSSAKKAANGLPILRVRDKTRAVYLVFETDLLDAKLAEIALVAPDGAITGNVTCGHLDRLGNANHAIPDLRWMRDKSCFEEGNRDD